MSSWQSLDDAACDVLGVNHVSTLDEAYTDEGDTDDYTDDDNDDDADDDHDAEDIWLC